MSALRYLLVLLVCGVGACEDDDANGNRYTASFGLMNGEPWEAQTWAAPFEVCGITQVAFEVYNANGLQAQGLSLSVYEVLGPGEHVLYERAFNDLTALNCARYPDTATASLATTDGDLVTARYDLAPQLGPCTVRIDSVDEARTYIAGELEAHFVVRGNRDRSGFALQLPDTVHFAELEFAVRVGSGPP